MDKLDFITIKGFKSISSIEKLSINPVNIILGANGSGKSNFISIFSFLNATREGRLQNSVRKAGGADQLLHFGATHTDQIEIFISFNDRVNQYKIVLEPDSGDALYCAKEVLYFWDKTKYDRPYEESISSNVVESTISQLQQNGYNQYGRIHYSGRHSGVIRYIAEKLKLWRLFHVHDTSESSPMRKRSSLNDNAFLRANGANLAAFLYMLQKKYPDHYYQIVKTIQLIAPFFRDFKLRPDPLNEESIFLEWEHQNSEEYFNVSHLSDGSLRFIFYATLFLQPEEFMPSVIVIDEPELGLHPAAITLLASLIKQASSICQVIVSTQSSLLLDYFEIEDIMIAELNEHGSTEIKRLEAKDLEPWLEEYSLGQLWEKNEFGARP